MAPKRMKIDYYLVETPEAAADLGDVIKNVSESANNENRNISINGKPIRLQTAALEGSFWVGDMVKIRMDGIPPKTRLNGEQADIDLDEDEGLGEETAFVYDPATKILCIQRNRYAVSAQGLARYFSKHYHPEYIELKPVLKHDALLRMDKLGVHRKLEVSVAGLKNLGILDGENASTKDLANMSKRLESPLVSMTFSMGTQKHGGLSIPSVISFVSSLLSKQQDSDIIDINRMCLSGMETEDGPKDVIDLLTERLIDIETVDTGRNYAQSRYARTRGLLKAFGRRYADLKRDYTRSKVG